MPSKTGGLRGVSVSQSEVVLINARGGLPVIGIASDMNHFWRLPGGYFNQGLDFEMRYME